MSEALPDIDESREAIEGTLAALDEAIDEANKKLPPVIGAFLKGEN